MTELRGLQLSLPEFRERGVEVVAVSPESVELNLGVRRKHHLDFPILSDQDLVATRAFGIVHEGAAPDGGDIPRPATFIIRQGSVRWKDLTDNWRVRPRPSKILAQLTRLGVPAP